MSSTTSCHNCLREVPIDSTWEEIIDGRTVYVCDNTDEECQILKPIIAAQRVEQARRKRVRKLQQEYWYSKMTRDEKKTFDRLPPFSALVKVPYYGDTCRPYASMPAVFVAPSTRKTYSYGASHETGLPVWGYEIEEVRDAILDVYDRVVAGELVGLKTRPAAFGEEFELQKTFERPAVPRADEEAPYLLAVVAKAKAEEKPLVPPPPVSTKKARKESVADNSDDDFDMSFMIGGRGKPKPKA